MANVVLLLASAVSTLGGLVFGYEMGIISGALLQLKVDFRLSCVRQEALVSSLLIGALLASIVGGSMIDNQGRRKSIIFSNILILAGSLVLLISSYAALVVGRITVGFAMCLSSMSCCIFVSEMVTPERRGFLVTLYEAGVTVGILAAYAINYLLSDLTRGWKWMFGLAIAPTLIQLVCVIFLPSSTKKSKYRRDCSQTERDLISSSESHESEDSKSIENKTIQYSSVYLFQRKDNMRTRTVIGLGLVLFQQFTGQPNVLLYASTIFHSVGFHSDSSAVLASVVLGLVKVIATLSSMVVSDRVGRRPLLISGCSVMALCLITIGLLSGQSMIQDAKRPCESEDFSANITDLPRLSLLNQSATEPPFNEDQRLLFNRTQTEDGLDQVGQTVTDSLKSSRHVNNQVVNWIILLCMMAVVTAYSTGFGPMTWLLLSEIFPAAIRGRAFAFTNCFNWAANLLVTFTFLNFIDLIGLSGIFFLYGVIAVVAAVFFHFMLPETKGKTLEEIDRELRSNRFYHNDACCGNLRSTSAKYQRVQCEVSSSG
ncbi:solute carrier family 2, facilitated glucose transporter member 10 [Notolabrus celidotus]|uniref:solute carrier family 2, facilitated glucose transporter member 10 n=1 Tax=Notolabrus celidotus TaxID=1203425 RepID=UPI00148F76C6|nr:solute carrier family 2, facilitated glucose transporter member 10 [Notolabrus celidotus]XP_034542905.1 solute carrier family 2, facilitated glucose transporter member 10 [Notolabrus celidotus]